MIDLKGDSQRYISNTVNVKNRKQIVNKGKNTVYLFTEGALLAQLHDSEQKYPDINSQSCFKTRVSPKETIACTIFSRVLIEDTVGDNVVSGALLVDKYSLEMETTSKVITCG